jgi:hypothetical protein
MSAQLFLPSGAVARVGPTQEGMLVTMEFGHPIWQKNVITRQTTVTFAATSPIYGFKMAARGFILNSPSLS